MKVTLKDSYLHDLKNILTALQGNLELLSRAKLSSGNRKSIIAELHAIIPEACHVMQSILQKRQGPGSVLTFSEAFQKSLACWQALSVDKKLRWRIDFVSTNPVTIASPDLLSLCHNILGNAVKHSQPRSTIRVTLSKDARNLTWITRNKPALDSGQAKSGKGLQFSRKIISGLKGKFTMAHRQKEYQVRILLPLR